MSRNPFGSIPYGESYYGPGTTTLEVHQLWNSWDSMGLLFGIKRDPEESNLDFRNRIVGDKEYNSSDQGLLNWLSDCLDEDRTIASSRLYIKLKNTPLSFQNFNKKDFKNETYIYPSIVSTIDDVETEYFFTSDVSDGEDINVTPDYVTISGVTYYLWKNQLGEYTSLITTDGTWSDIKIRYLNIVDSQLVMYEEVPELETI